MSEVEALIELFRWIEAYKNRETNHFGYSYLLRRVTEAAVAWYDSDGPNAAGSSDDA